MSKRNRREHGRILSVETMQRGSALDVDAAAGATSITVTDAGDFDEDGGWLYIGAQVIEYSECDDDTGAIALADPLAAAAEQGDPVAVYDPLYEEVVDYQEAHVQLDGEYDNLDPVIAEVAEGVGDLPEGDRGRAGESCTLLRVADDEWEVVGVGGRPRSASGVESIRWEQDDAYTLTAADVTAGTMTMPLTHRPIDEALTCVLAGAPQRPTEWTIGYDAQTLTIPLNGWEQAGDVAWVHYAYRKGITTPAGAAPMPTLVLASSQRNSASGAIDITGVEVGDIILGAAFVGSTVTPSIVLTGGGAFTQIATGVGTHLSLTANSKCTGIVGARIADATDVGAHTFNFSGDGVVAADVVILRGATLPTAADTSVEQCENATPTLQAMPSPAVSVGGGKHVSFFGLAGGSGQIAQITVDTPLTSLTEVDVAHTVSSAAAWREVAGVAERIHPAYSIVYNGGLENGSDWPWVSFSVAVRGA